MPASVECWQRGWHNKEFVRFGKNDIALECAKKENVCSAVRLNSCSFFIFFHTFWFAIQMKLWASDSNTSSFNFNC